MSRSSIASSMSSNSTSSVVWFHVKGLLISVRFAFAVVAIVHLFLAIVIAIHDTAMPEDLTVVWMCHVQGNGLCGPETPWIQFEPANLFRAWDWVILYWWEQLYGVFH